MTEGTLLNTDVHLQIYDEAGQEVGKDDSGRAAPVKVRRRRGSTSSS